MHRENPGKSADVTPGSAAEVWLTTADGVRVHGGLYGDPSADVRLGFVVGHGFTNHVAKPTVRRVLRRLAVHAPTLGIDFRGHGRSGGRSGLGRDETADVTAAVHRMRDLGCRHVVTLGFSLGGSVVLRQAAGAVQRPDAVVAVSSPARWWVRETAAMRRVHWLLEQPHGRWTARLLGVRLGSPWEEVPESPIEAAARLRGTPTLIVHGAWDHYFPVEEAVALAEVAGARLWVRPGMRHGESAATPTLVDRIATWSTDRVSSPHSGKPETGGVP